MAASPRFKVYSADGTYQASCKESEAAASLMAFYGEGAKIKDQGYLLVWHEGHEAIPASESYDYVASLIWTRISNDNRRRAGKAGLRFP